MGLGRIYFASTAPATDHVAQIVQNAGSNLSLSASGLGIKGNGRIVGVTIRAVQNLIYELYFWRSSGFNAAIGSGGFLGRCAFVVADGTQIAATGLFHYHKACDIPLIDDGNGSAIHHTLVNRSATAHAAGASTIKIEFHIDMCQGG